MSATLDTMKFQQYLLSYHNNKKFPPQVIDIDININDNHAKVIDVDDKTPYRIYKWYLDDLCSSKSNVFQVLP
jgi:hypothetical protein